MESSINKSRLFKRAWYLTKTKYGSFAYNLKKVWAEMKEESKRQAVKLINASYPEMIMTTWTPSPETMQAYYSSNCYKGD